jgi:dihydroflavonol-4-reductase
MPLEAILAEIARQHGGRAPLFKVPRLLAYAAAFAAEIGAGITGREPFATLDGVRLSKKRMYFTSAKAVRELGYRARPAREGIADALRWFAANGYLR